MGIDDERVHGAARRGAARHLQGRARRVSGAGALERNGGQLHGAGCPLWANKQALESYDIVILSCECGREQPDQARRRHAGAARLARRRRQGLREPLPLHLVRRTARADFKGVATWLGGRAARRTWDNCTTSTRASRKAWSSTIGSPTSGALSGTGTIDLKSVADQRVVREHAQTTQRWIYDRHRTNDTKYMSFLTPIGGIPKTADAGGEARNTAARPSSRICTHGSACPSADIPRCAARGQRASARGRRSSFCSSNLAACVSDDSQPRATRRRPRSDGGLAVPADFWGYKRA